MNHTFLFHTSQHINCSITIQCTEYIDFGYVLSVGYNPIRKC